MKDIVIYNNQEFRLETFKWHSKNYLKDFSDTVSLKKLEKALKNIDGSRLQYVSGGYLYYNCPTINPIKYPALFKIRNDFEAALNEGNKLNSYWKVNHSLYVRAIKITMNNEAKEDYRNEIRSLIDEYNLSYSSISSSLNIDKGNLYRYVNNDLNSSLGLEKIIEVHKELSKLKENNET